MKFSYGQWVHREGIKVHSPAEICDVKITESSLTVYTPTHPITRRGDTLGGPLITIRYSSPMPDVIRVEVFNLKGTQQKLPEFLLQTSGPCSVTVDDTENSVALTSGGLRVSMNKTNGSKISYQYKEKLLTSSGPKGLAYITDKDGNPFMREQLLLRTGECVYGLGERFTAFVKNGQNVEMWNEDGGTASELAYKNIPFYITNLGYGVFVNHPECVSFEVASEMVSKMQFSVPGQSLEYFIISGDSLKDVLANYTALTGKPALPPAWTFGLWLTTSFTTSYDEATVNSFIDGMIERELPLSVFHFDCFWMKEFQWCDFEWDKNVFPDPEGMLKRLKAKGLKICVWINPYIAQKSKLFDEGMENGYLLKRPDGGVWQWEMWQPGMGIVDFTNPEACSWYQSKLQALLDMGVDCFKTDFGERIPTNVAYHDGSDPLRMHNYYTYLYNKTVFELLEKERGVGEAALFARSATVGGQKFPVHWGGDCAATYESMAESLRGGLSLCLSGFGFWSHDISGFEATATPDIYKRWVAFGLLSSHSRLHGNASYRVPWLFDEEAVEVLRFFTKLKLSLMPYLFAAACEASRTGVPMLRAMILEFTRDVACDSLDRQYMLGESLLVAPIFNEEGTVSYYLPEGTWTNFFTGEKVSGGRWFHEKHGYQSIPLMIRPNSILAIGKDSSTPDYDFADNVTLHAFELDDGSSTTAMVYNPQGCPELEVLVSRTCQIIHIQVVQAIKPWSMVLCGISIVSSVDGARCEASDPGVKIIPEKGSEKITVYLENAANAVK